MNVENLRRQLREIAENTGNISIRSKEYLTAYMAVYTKSIRKK